MRSARPQTLALALACVALLVGGAGLLHQGLRGHDIVVATPSPPGPYADTWLPLRPGDRACIAPVRFTPASGKVKLTVLSPTAPVPALRVVTTGVGSSTTVRGYAAGKPAPVIAPLAVQHASTGSVCVRNAGRTAVGLGATGDPIYFAAPTTRVNGRLTRLRAGVSLLAPTQSSTFGRLPDAVRQDAQLTGVLSRPLVWLLLAIVLVGLVAAPLFAVVDALREDDEASG